MAPESPAINPSATLPSTPMTSTTPFQPPEPEGAAVLLIGPSGSGKTYSTTTLLDCGLELFYFGTENRFMESVQQALEDRRQSLERVHWCHVYPATVSWETLIRQSEIIGAMNYDSLSKIKTMAGKEAYGQFTDIYRKLSNFIDERTGRSFGPVDSWGPDRALVLDGISGAALMSMHLIQGGKPVAHQGEWGVAMSNLESLIIKLASDTKCFVVMLGHVEREPDATGGGTLLTVSTLGQKLSPKIGRHFSEIILARREGSKYLWDTMSPGVDLKRRVLPLSQSIEPHFRPIVEAWKRRLVQLSLPT
jgi:hypothetical protein